MKVYTSGRTDAPAIMLLPGTCCHWEGNFGQVIPLLSREFHVLTVSYDGFDESERTEFPTIMSRTCSMRNCWRAIRSSGQSWCRRF